MQGSSGNLPWRRTSHDQHLIIYVLEIIRYLRAAGDVLLPRTCIVCGCRLNLDENHLCLGCIMDMPLTRFWERGHNPMSDKFNERIQERVSAKAADGTEKVGYEHYAYAAALFTYHSEAGYRQIPYQIKYQGNTAVGKDFGIMLGRKLAKASEWRDADMVIPVPLHWMRFWKRGYNQAEVIARGVAEAMDIPLRTDVLVRRRRTRTQTKLEIQEKMRNVDGAFGVSEDARLIFRYGGQVRHIVLVDDVFTTGSTLESCFNALRSVFPPHVRISVAALGYVER